MRISSRIETATSNQVFPLTTYDKAPLKQYASQQPGGARRTECMVASSTVHIRECSFFCQPQHLREDRLLEKVVHRGGKAAFRVANNLVFLWLIPLMARWCSIDGYVSLRFPAYSRYEETCRLHKTYQHFDKKLFDANYSHIPK